MSLLLYLAELPGQTPFDPAYGPSRPAKCAATLGFLIKIVGVFGSAILLLIQLALSVPPSNDWVFLR